VRASRWNVAALIVAAVMVMAAGSFLVLSVLDRSDARAALHRAEVALTRERAQRTAAVSLLTHARSEVRALRPQLDALARAGDIVALFDGQSLAAVKAAVGAGLAGDVAGYNAGVAQLNTINAGHDAALEKLRVQVNTLVLALDPLRS
jgi:hypothetical protein